MGALVKELTFTMRFIPEDERKSEWYREYVKLISEQIIKSLK